MNTSVVVVGGGGHVGLPLSIVFAEKGIETFAFDISSSTVAKINNGVMPFLEENADAKLIEVLKTKRLKATSSPECISSADFVVIVIGTPVDEHLSPDPNSVLLTLRELTPYLRSGQTIILRSTVFPGVTKKVSNYLGSQFRNIRIAYCPERIIEGKALQEIVTLPQIIGVFDDASFESTKKLFDIIGVETIRVRPEEAELAKLFTNVWRYIKFSAANQFWMMANDLGVDYEVVRNAISHNYPRASDLPRPGFAAGPCLFKDTMQLAALVQQNFPLGHAAMMINEGTPGYLVGRMKKIYPLQDMTIGILGMAFKGNVDDTRSSLAFKLKKLLMFESKEVLVSDPFVADVRILDIEEVIQRSDLLVIGAPHDLYRKLTIDKPIIDIWGIRGDGVLV